MPYKVCSTMYSVHTYIHIYRIYLFDLWCIFIYGVCIFDLFLKISLVPGKYRYNDNGVKLQPAYIILSDLSL